MEETLNQVKIVQRSSNFELLRILAMLAIIAGHFIGQSGSYDVLSGINLYIATFLGSASRIAVSVFLTMGIWFMLDSKFKSSKVLKLYGQLICYTIPIFIILKCLHVHVSLWHTVRAIFPFYTFALWFVSAYIVLILLAPFLNLILNFSRITLKKLLILSFIFIPLLCMIFTKMDTKLDVFIYFMFAYLYVGYFKKYLYKDINWNKYLLIFGAFILYLFMVTIKYYYLQTCNLGFIYKLDCNYLGDYKSIPNLLISLPIFYFFLKTDIGSSKMINFTAKSCLATYIIHQAPGFQDYLWHNIYNCDIGLASHYPAIYILFVIISLYGTCMLIDYLRRTFVEPLWIKSKIYKSLEAKINHFYSGIKFKELSL